MNYNNFNVGLSMYMITVLKLLKLYSQSPNNTRIANYSDSTALVITPSPIDQGTEYCFRSISLFIYLFTCMYFSVLLSFFVSTITTKREKPAMPRC